MKTITILLQFFLFVFVSQSFAQQAEFIWAEDDYSGSKIFLSQYKNGVWQPAEKIVDDGNLNILPALGSDTKGQRLAVWSTVEGAQSVLKYSLKRGNGWSQPAVLTNQFLTNLAPVVVFDNNDVCWVFWSANSDDDDDIYVSRFVKGTWSRPEKVNNENNMPDILPEAGQDDNGNVWVSWQQLQESGYVEVTRSYETTNRKKMAARESMSMQQVKQLKLRSNLKNSLQPPTSFNARSRATLHFPNDKKRPSKLVKGKFN